MCLEEFFIELLYGLVKFDVLDDVIVWIFVIECLGK